MRELLLNGARFAGKVNCFPNLGGQELAAKS